MGAASPLRLSVGLPQNLTGDDPRVAAAYAKRAEALGFAGLWTLDSALGGPTGHTPLLDGLHLLSHVAAVTETPRLGVAVIVRGAASRRCSRASSRRSTASAAGG